MKIELHQYGLDWNVDKIQLGYQKGNSNILTPFYGLIRNDTQFPLGSCTQKYNVKQNSEISSLIEIIAEKSGMTLERAGYYRKGKKIFFILKNENFITIGGDKITKYFYILSSHDGKGSIAFGISNKVWSCQNQYNRFYKNSTLKIRHNSSATDKILEADKIIGEFFEKEKNVYNMFDTFTGNDVSKKLVDQLLQDLLNFDRLDKDQQTSKLILNKYDEIHTSIKKEMNTKGENYWGLFNGVTYWANHVKKNSKIINQDESINVGSGYSYMNKAYDFLVENIDK
jgi:hypothetical protein